ncbi:MAG: transposase [Galactobacter sp.]
MTKKKTRKTYTPEYRAEAAGLVIQTDRPIVDVARELGIGPALLGRWVTQAREAAEAARTELDVDEKAELKRLRKENLELKKDNEFLGKAAAFFAAKRQ